VISIRSRPAKPGHHLLRNDPDRTVVGQHHVLYTRAIDPGDQDTSSLRTGIEQAYGGTARYP